MLTGFNTNVPYKGKTYHVQSEDTGGFKATVATLLYFKGSILARKSFNYSEVLDKDGWQGKVAGMMKKQHIAMIKELLAGVHVKAGGPEGAPAG